MKTNEMYKIVVIVLCLSASYLMELKFSLNFFGIFFIPHKKHKFLFYF